MARIKNVDVLHGNLFKSVILFGIPLLFVGLIQSLFNAVDIMVLGQMADTHAVAAVGATTTIVSLLVTLALGIASGAKIVLARLIGEGVKEKTEQTVFTSIMTSFILGGITMVVGVFLAPAFLTLTQCPQEIFADAKLYMQIYFAASPAIMLYNFGSTILQVSGDSKRPLFYMIISGLMNLILNFVLCFILSQKVAAVAIATAISQIVGAILVFRRILVMEGDCRLRLRGGKWNWFSFRKLMSNGLPIGFSTALYSIASLQIQSALNTFGSDAIAGSAATTNLESIESSIVAAPWGSTAGVFVGQNVGADNKKRVKKSILVCTAISITLGAVFSAIIAIFSRPILSLFVTEENAIVYGQIRILYIIIPYVIACLNGILSHTIQAFGYSIFSTINSIICVLIFRIIWMQYVYPLCPTFHVLMQCFLVSWILIAVVNLIFFFYLYYRKFKADKIKKMG